jgi:hypothetical protein
MAKAAATQMAKAAVEIPTDLASKGVTEIATSLRALLADTFVLYVKRQKLAQAGRPGKLFRGNREHRRCDTRNTINQC